MAEETEDTQATGADNPAGAGEESAVETVNEMVESAGADSIADSADTESAPVEPEVVLAPKERRQQARAAKAAKAPARAATTPEERQAARDEERRSKAVARRHERARQRRKYKDTEHERQATPPREHVAGTQKVRQGIVVSDKADKTITVRIDVARRHRRYAKIVRTSNTVHAHDERNDAHIGDTVVVREARPLSRTKRWRLVEIVERAR
jgi:small subunit ribosomal protein S17